MQCSVNSSPDLKAALNGWHWKISRKIVMKNHIRHAVPTMRVFCLKALVLNIRRHKSRIAIFTIVIVRQYVIIPPMINYSKINTSDFMVVFLPIGTSRKRRI